MGFRQCKTKAAAQLDDEPRDLGSLARDKILGFVDCAVADMKRDYGVTPKPVEGIGTKAAYVEGQLVIQHGRHLAVVMFFNKRPRRGSSESHN